jgi:Na+/Pi-cotransporter
MLSLNIATGVILVLLGMRYVRKGLDRLFGSQLVDWLQQMTNNRYKAFFGGMVAGNLLSELADAEENHQDTLLALTKEWKKSARPGV